MDAARWARVSELAKASETRMVARLVHIVAVPVRQICLFAGGFRLTGIEAGLPISTIFPRTFAL